MLPTLSAFLAFSLPMRRPATASRPRQSALRPLLPAIMCAPVVLACGGATPDDAIEPTITEVDGVRVVQNHSPRWPEGSAWRISSEPILILGVDAGEASQMFTYPTPFRLSDGTIVVADRGSKEIRAFDDEGRHRWTAGGTGEGPGEFESISYPFATPDGRIVVGDGYKARVTMFASDGTVVHAGDPAPQDNPRFFQYPTIQAAFSDGSLLAMTDARDGLTGIPAGERGWRPAGVWRYSPMLDEVEFLVELDFYEGIGESHGQPVPFSTRSWLRPNEGGFYFVNGRRPEIGVYDIDGTLRARFVIDREAVPVTAEDRDRWLQKSLDNYEEAGQEFAPERRDAMVYPDTMPTWRNMLVDDDDNVWVERFLGLQHAQPLYWGRNSDPFFPVTDSVWDVVVADGTWLGAVELPPDLTVRQIGDSWVLMTGEDDEGVARVYLYELLKE